MTEKNSAAMGSEDADKPYIYAGNLDSNGLIEWLEKLLEQLIAQKGAQARISWAVHDLSIACGLTKTATAEISSTAALRLSSSRYKNLNRLLEDIDGCEFFLNNSGLRPKDDPGEYRQAEQKEYPEDREI